MVPNTCTLCGTQISPTIAAGLCPACLLESGLSAAGAADNGADTSGPARAGRSGDVSARATPDGHGRIGDYELLGEIARGGQGVIYRARHVELKREVALKLIPFGPWSVAGQVERFRTEARVTAELDHPAIVPIFEIGEAHGQHYFAMKLIDGVSLNRLPAEQMPPPRRAAEIIVEVARAIQHAHEHGVLHRDIKPGNILLDAGGRPHITDFGLAKLLDGDIAVTQSLEVLGTPGYISPEMAVGDRLKLSAATDVYGLGAVLYHLLTGHPPFEGVSTLETVRRVIENETKPPRAWNARLDRDLELICLKCLEKEPSRRYPTAAALAGDLENWLQHKPVQARGPGLMYRGRKWIRRHAVAVSVALLVAAAGAIAVLLSARARLPAAEMSRAVKILDDIEATQQDFELAEDVLKDVLARRPADPRATTLMAQLQNVFLYRGFDRSDERKATARHFADRAVQLAPDDPDAIGALAVCLIEQRTDFARAVALLDRAIALKPSDPFLHRFRVNTLYSDKHASAADIVAAAEQTAALFPNDALAQYQMARIYRDSGQYAEMDVYLDRTIAIAPVTNALVWKSLSALWVRGDVAEMKTWLDRVTPRIRTTERVIFIQWCYAMASGKIEDGIDALQTLPKEWVKDWLYSGPKDLLIAQLLDVQGKSTLARLHFEAAHAEVRRRQADDPSNAGLRALEVWILHGLRRDEEARELYHDYFLPLLQRPYRVGVLTDWWFDAIACGLLIGDRAWNLHHNAGR